MTNHVGMALKLQQQCTGDHDHSWLIGNQDGKSKSSAAQVYPPKLLDTILAEYARTTQVKATDIEFAYSMDVVRVDADHVFLQKPSKPSSMIYLK